LQKIKVEPGPHTVRKKQLLAKEEEDKNCKMEDEDTQRSFERMPMNDPRTPPRPPRPPASNDIARLFTPSPSRSTAHTLNMSSTSRAAGLRTATGCASMPSTLRAGDGYVGPTAVPDATLTHARLMGIGTQDYSYVIMANVDRPGQNMGFGLEFLPDIRYDDHTSFGVNIRCTVPVPDHKEWTASIPPNGYYVPGLGLEKSLVLIKCPSQNFWFRNTEVFNKKLKCGAIKAVQQATENEIEKEEAASSRTGYLSSLPPYDSTTRSSLTAVTIQALLAN
jgi:hypothetical protein